VSGVDRQCSKVDPLPQLSPLLQRLMTKITLFTAVAWLLLVNAFYHNTVDSLW